MVDMQACETKVDEAKAMAVDAGSWLQQRGCLFWGIAGVVALVLIGEYGPDAPPKDAAQHVAEAAVDAAEAEAAGYKRAQNCP